MGILCEIFQYRFENLVSAVLAKQGKCLQDALDLVLLVYDLGFKASCLKAEYWTIVSSLGMPPALRSVVMKDSRLFREIL